MIGAKVSVHSVCSSNLGEPVPAGNQTRNKNVG